MNRHTEEAIEAAAAAAAEMERADREWRQWESFGKKAERRYKLASAHLAKLMAQVQIAFQKQAQEDHHMGADKPMTATEVLRSQTPVDPPEVFGVAGNRTMRQLWQAIDYVHKLGGDQVAGITGAELATMENERPEMLTNTRGLRFSGVRIDVQPMCLVVGASLRSHVELLMLATRTLANVERTGAAAAIELTQAEYDAYITPPGGNRCPMLGGCMVIVKRAEIDSHPVGGCSVCAVSPAPSPN